MRGKERKRNRESEREREREEEREEEEEFIVKNNIIFTIDVRTCPISLNDLCTCLLRSF